ncbi:hypothetical protein ACTFIW_008753 [Dictyostelium discoideum]
MPPVLRRLKRYQRICHIILERSINRRFNKRRMFIKPQKDNGLTCQTRFQDCCSQRKLPGLKGKLIALKNAVIPFRLYTRRTNKFHSHCLTQANGDWDQSFPIPQKSEISHWLTVLNQWNGKKISLFPSYDYVLSPSFRDESQIIFKSNQELQLATEEGSVQSNPTSIWSNPDGSVRISGKIFPICSLNSLNRETSP